MPLILGFAVVSGILFLVAAIQGENDVEPKDSPKTKDLDKTKFDVEEIRRLRKGLRQQMKAKKKNNTPPTSAPPQNG